MTSAHESHVQLPPEWSGRSSPGTSRNEQFLFSVAKVKYDFVSWNSLHMNIFQASDGDNPSLESVRSGESETSSKKLTPGMIVTTEGDDANEDGDDGGECDGDVFDAEGW